MNNTSVNGIIHRIISLSRDFTIAEIRDIIYNEYSNNSQLLDGIVEETLYMIHKHPSNDF